MPGPPNQDRMVREAFRLASDLMMDLVAGTQIYYLLTRRFPELEVPDHVRVAVTRLCLFHTIISLSKWVELYDRYLSIIPLDSRDIAKSLKKEVEERGIVDFRNKVVGHIWDDDQGRALTNAEVAQRLDVITKSDVAGLFKWVNDGKLEPNPKTATGMIEHVRDRIREAYSLSDDDLHK